MMHFEVFLNNSQSLCLMSSKLGQKGTFMMLEKYLTTIRRIKLRCLVKRGICLLLVSRTWIVHCFAAYLKQLIIFFLSSSICYLYLLTPLSHMYYSLNLSYFFLINVIPFILVFFLFTIIQILIDFFRRIFF